MQRIKEAFEGVVVKNFVVIENCVVIELWVGVEESVLVKYKVLGIWSTEAGGDKRLTPYRKLKRSRPITGRNWGWRVSMTAWRSARKPTAPPRFVAVVIGGTQII